MPIVYFLFDKGPVRKETGKPCSRSKTHQTPTSFVTYFEIQGKLSLQARLHCQKPCDVNKLTKKWKFVLVFVIDNTICLNTTSIK